jgi:signal transduction histidine kinase
LFVPTATVLIATVVVVSAWNAWLSLRRAELAVQTQVRRIASEFEQLSVPLQTSVLRITAQLTGVELVVQPTDGPPVASDESFLSALPMAEKLPVADQIDKLSASHGVRVGETVWLHGSTRLRRSAVAGEPVRLHVFYPQRLARNAWIEAIWPPLAVGTVAVIAMMGVTYWMSRRFVQPIHDLQAQSAKIAGGDYRIAAVPSRDDELRDLAIDFNRMAERLSAYESEVRTGERLATLNTLGSAVAHQIRNAATGAKMALDLHVADTVQVDESLSVARQQLELIETHVQRFLAIGKPGETARHDFDLSQTVKSAIRLVLPMARHWGVDMRAVEPAEQVSVHGDAVGFQQAIVNLLTNAVEAAVANEGEFRSDTTLASVEVVWRGTADGWLVEIRDSGLGPAPDIAKRLFTPFTTNRRGGTGLGLFMAKQVAIEHDATLTWCREGATTIFSMAKGNTAKASAAKELVAPSQSYVTH